MTNTSYLPDLYPIGVRITAAALREGLWDAVTMWQGPDNLIHMRQEHTDGQHQKLVWNRDDFSRRWREEGVSFCMPCGVAGPEKENINEIADTLLLADLLYDAQTAVEEGINKQALALVAGAILCVHSLPGAAVFAGRLNKLLKTVAPHLEKTDTSNHTWVQVPFMHWSLAMRRHPLVEHVAPFIITAALNNENLYGPHPYDEMKLVCAVPPNALEESGLRGSEAVGFAINVQPGNHTYTDLILAQKISDKHFSADFDLTDLIHAAAASAL